MAGSDRDQIVSTESHLTDEQIRTGVPSGAQTDTTAGQSSPVDSDELEVDQMSEEDAWKAFPKQVQAAITYAGANKYDYGPRLRKQDLHYTVVSAQSMNDEITRVVLSYRPENRFKGEAGSEYLDVDRDGVIQARRQIRVAKESMPWILVGLAALSIIAAAVLVPLIVLVDEKADTTFVSGRTLWVQSDQPRVGAYVTYDAIDSEGTPRKWIIVPEGEGTSIAYVNLRLINQTSGVVNLAIDTDSVEVTTEDGIIIRPVDLLARVAWPAEGAELNPRLNVQALPLWGDRSLASNQELAGFVAFEVPAGSKIRSLRWAATDVANIRY